MRSEKIGLKLSMVAVIAFVVSLLVNDFMPTLFIMAYAIAIEGNKWLNQQVISVFLLKVFSSLLDIVFRLIFPTWEMDMIASNAAKQLEGYSSILGNSSSSRGIPPSTLIFWVFKVIIIGLTIYGICNVYKEKDANLPIISGLFKENAE